VNDARLDWIRAGEDHLREHGAAGLKIAALAERRGATTGSFYHHFANFGSYLDELADHYASVDPHDAFRLVEKAPPVERLRTLFSLAQEREIQPLDHAMRVWAATNPRAEKAVRALDARFLQFLREIFLELGFSDDEARTRALLGFSANAAIVYSPWEVDDADFERGIALLTTR
jgi:AcrR family transcriptional regulator